MVDPQIASFLWRVTEFGDAVYIVPAVAGATVALWIAGKRDAARALALAFGLCLAVTVVAKVALIFSYRGGPLRSPSGHTAISAFFYGSIALLLWKRDWAPLPRMIGVGACLALVGLIAVSRFEVGGHSRTETAVGLVFGAAAVAFFAARLNWAGRARAVLPAALVGLAVAAAAHVVLATGYFDEETIKAFALWLRQIVFRA